MKTAILIVLILIGFDSAFARIIKVNAFGGGNFSAIQQGIDDALIYDTVLVYPGDYFESIDFKGKDIIVGSLYLITGDTAYIGCTIINGNHERNQLVKFISGETREAILIGFTITNAYDDIGLATVKVTGLGIYIENSSPTIEHNSVVNNEFGDWYIAGAGIAMINSSAKICNNKIANNNYAFRGGGIYIEGGADQIIENNFLENNFLTSGYGVCYGGGIYLMSTQRTIIQNNTIEENYLDYGGGSAIYALDCDSIMLISNKCRNNKSLPHHGEVQFELSTGKIINTLFYNSKYPNRTLLKFESSIFSVINSTIVNNSQITVSLVNSSADFFNTILYGINDSITGKQIALLNSEAIFTNCDIEGDTTGFELTGNSSFQSINTISADPLYMGSGEDPFGLSENSPCIDKGMNDTTIFILPATDLSGGARIVRNIVDIGAYENQLIESMTFVQSTKKVLLFPNPANEWIEFKNIESLLNEEINVRIYNAEGVLVAKKELDGSNKVNVGNLKPGFYLAELIFDQEKTILKFIKE